KAREAIVTSYINAATAVREHRLRLYAEQLGREVAERGTRINELYLKAAQIQQEIEELQAQIAQLDEQAKDQSNKAAGARLAYAQRMKDLAAVAVEAIKQAGEEAQKLADDVKVQLDNQSADLIRTEKNKRARHEEQQSLGIFKA